MTIVVPSRLDALLAGDRRLRSAVDSLVSSFSDWIADSKLPFFPDYTDHGGEHISQVLMTASSLITEDAYTVFSSADAAVLIVSTLLHDSAMHLSEAGFFRLIYETPQRAITSFDIVGWRTLWDEYLYSAKRWDDQQMLDVLGGEQRTVTTPVSQVRDPFAHYDNLTKSDCRLIGEFIRKHHPRLAHEFAVFGIPGNDCDFIKPAEILQPDVSDITGLVARSHGLPIRNCLDYLNKRYHRREYQGIHAVFVMALLRVGDFWHIREMRS